jgi:UDP-2,3-diacylglucosamine pyrophosphatase LpxH
MTADPFRTLVVSDLHLADPADDRTAAEALVAFVDEHRASPPAPGMRWRLVVAGDLFDLEVRRGRAGKAWRSGAAAAVDGLVRDFPAVWEALRAFAAAGNRVVVIPGNHDAALAEPLGAARVRKEIGHGTQVTPLWRDAARGLIVAHGHQQDPDNRFAVWPPAASAAAPVGTVGPATKGAAPAEDASLGVLMTRLFVGPMRFRVRSEVEGTPLKNLLGVMLSHGLGAPVIVFAYLWAALRIVLFHSGARFFAARAAAVGSSGAADAAGVAVGEGTVRVMGVAPDELPAWAALDRVAARPTLARRWNTFHRLYLGRVVITLAATAVVLGLLLAPHRAWTPWAALAGALAPLVFFAVRGNLYAHRVRHALEAAAHALVDGGHARTVVFGHLHHRVDLALAEGGRYLNAGMFFTRRGGAALSFVREEADGLRLASSAIARPSRVSAGASSSPSSSSRS